MLVMWAIMSLGHFVTCAFCAMGRFMPWGSFVSWAVLSLGDRPFWAGTVPGLDFACASYSGLHSLGKGGCIRLATKLLMRACSAMFLISDSSILGSISMYISRKGFNRKLAVETGGVTHSPVEIVIITLCRIIFSNPGSPAWIRMDQQHLQQDRILMKSFY